jgi:phosphatidylserine decarboxylase
MRPSVLLQHLVPQRLMSAVVRRATHARWRPWKDFLIDTIARTYGVDRAEALSADNADYEHFNAFFTRALKPGARPFDPDPNALLMPADGRVSQVGRIREGTILQAKNHHYSAAALLADEQAAAPFRDGAFATIYLSPRDYHRVHMPWTGTLRETVHIPGRLFSVGVDAVGSVSKLFARNERLVCHFDTDFGPMAVVMVGALLVSGVETVWGGMEIPPYGGPITVKDYRGRGIVLERFAEMARFNYGSTAIVLLPRGVAELDPALHAQAPVRLGQRLALLVGQSRGPNNQ